MCPKNKGRLTNAYLLPNLDEMVLLKPMQTLYTMKNGPGVQETTRVESVNEQLLKYNRWLSLVKASNPDKAVRTAATDLQRSVHEVNSYIATILMEVDQKILDLQEHTENFVNAVKKADSKQLTRDILSLSLEEMETILTETPHDPDPIRLKQLRDLVLSAMNCSCNPPFEPPFEPPVYCFKKGFVDKLLRIISEVETLSPGGTKEALHLYIYVKAHAYEHWNLDFGGPIGSKVEIENLDRRTREFLARCTNRGGNARNGGFEKPVFFDYAAAKRELWSEIQRGCLTCPPQDDMDPNDPSTFANQYPMGNNNNNNLNAIPPPPFIPDPILRGPCKREDVLPLVETLQERAYGEIKAGVMLTLSKRLPSELCLLIFEATMAAEEVDLGVRCFERPRVGGSNSKGPVKARYRCPADRRSHSQES